MKRVAARLILISYLLMAYGHVLETGCCQNEPAHSASEHTAHEHVRSKALVAVHCLSHWPAQDDTQRLLSGHRCCLKQGEHEPGLLLHSFTPRLHRPTASDFPGSAIPPEKPDMLVTGLNVRSSHMLGDLGAAFVLQSIQSTILLI